MSGNNDDLKEILEKDIEKAYKGRQLWIELRDKHQWGDGDYVILMPSDDKECNYYSLLYLNSFINQNKGQRAYLLTCDEGVKRNAARFSDKICDIIDFSRESAECLMKFYSLYTFTDKLIIASLNEPEGRSGLRLIGKKGLSVEEIVAIGIYGLRKFEKQADIEYI